MINVLKTMVLKILFLSIYLLNIFIPKQGNLIIFTSEYGKVFRGNPRFLFDYVINQVPEFEAIWVSSVYDTYIKIKNKYPENVVYLYSLKGFRTIIRSKFIVFHQITFDFGDVPFNKKKQIFIQTFHGIIFKKLGFKRKKTNKELNLLKKTIDNYYNIIISTSEEESKSIIECYHVKNEKIIISGHPRNDILNKNINDKSIIKNIIKYKNKFDKVILYAPTYRDTSQVKYFPFSDMDYDKLNNFLKEKEMILLIHSHINEFNRGLSFKKEMSKIIPINKNNLEDNLIDIQQVLAVTDILITDYSSIFLDFLLLDRPIIFIPYDLKQYEKERGLLFEYDSNTPGPKINSLNDFIQELEKASKGIDLYKGQRKEILDKFHKYKDNKSSERIINHIKKYYFN